MRIGLSVPSSLPSFSQAGLTYDSKTNGMLKGGRISERLDRIFCKLKDFVVEDVQLVGTESIHGLTFTKTRSVKKVMQEVQLPVLPSDHYGILLHLQIKQPEAKQN
eukprot:TRINITY_DN1640_c0_g1_i7.p2 TRINITY_DN1640_c0_g1~~TRINITY_DN1640_c0_g1_i7.p2  ORF type:complete len:106 (+),score=37.21 TRINITY_DN1640_c0_g1_i7:70-387(+)